MQNNFLQAALDYTGRGFSGIPVRGDKKLFPPSRRFRKDYDRLFRKDPASANVLLLLCELANEKGQVSFETHFPEVEIQRLMAARFTDPRAYQLPRGPKR